MDPVLFQINLAAWHQGMEWEVEQARTQQAMSEAGMGTY